jgi:hypothetical protein
MWRLSIGSADRLDAPRFRIIEVIGSLRKELYRNEMVTKPGLPNNSIARFSRGSDFEKCGRQMSLENKTRTIRAETR